MSSNAFEYFIERAKKGERALLVNISIGKKEAEAFKEEFLELVNAADFNIIDYITGKRELPTPKYLVGKGKAEEIKDLVQSLDIETIIMNHELTPAQGRNLEKLCQCHVMTRTELILHIFAKRAQTFEGKLQVELAHLKHLTTRLVGGWTHLERQRGGIGLRGGAGEKQLEMDRRSLNRRIHTIERRLQKVLKQRQQRKKRGDQAAIPTIALVGYTNSGKSTLFNLLTKSNVYVQNQLFATLDPTLRQLKLPYFEKIILVDTVGFIQDLPHELVAAFRATLEETRKANFLLHLIDAAHPDRVKTVENVQEILKEIGALDVPQLKILNKIDLLDHFQPRVDRDQEEEIRGVWISAKEKKGIDLLKNAIVERLSKEFITCCLVLKSSEAKLRARLYQIGAILHEKISKEGYFRLTLKIAPQQWQKLFKS